MKLTIPEFSLVVLIGASGSGKSTFAKKHFSDKSLFSAQVVDDFEKQFEALEEHLKESFAQGLSVVIELGSFSEQYRKRLLALAKTSGARPCAIIFKLPAPILRERYTEPLSLSIGKQLEMLSKTIEALPDEGFTNIYLLDGFAAIETSEVKISYELDLGWSKLISERYQDYGRPPSKPLYFEDYDYIEQDLEYAANLVFTRKATANIARTSLPVLLVQLLGDDGTAMQFLIESSRTWLEDEQDHLRAYWFSLWHSILRDKGAFDRWDTTMPAANFINNIHNPEPFLAIWQRCLQKLEKAPLRHLVNTILEAESLRPELAHWLKQATILQTLERAFFEYQNSEFGQRISLAENKLKAIKRQNT